MALPFMISGRANRDDIAAYLDSLDHARRVLELSRLSRGDQRELFKLVSGAAPLTLEHFVPAGISAVQEVIHYGKNTLPLARVSRFEKRFCSPVDGGGRLFGYNEGWTRPFVGPGYFVAVPTEGRGDWQERGALVIDYLQLPAGPLPRGWPAVVPNSAGLSRVVYYGTRDFMRRVSSHVSIGAAFRGERALGTWFTLCREP